MSYARIGEFGSDVYVYRDTAGVLFCQSVGKAFGCTDEQEMIDHLRSHRRRGQNVPQRALDRLEAERDGLPWETDVEAALRELKEQG